MSFPNELNSYLERITNSKKEFINALRTLKVKSKEKLILEHYNHMLTNSNPWLSIKPQMQQTETKNHSQSNKVDINLRITQLIDNLTKNPNQKQELILYFLTEFNVINENDRKVLAENFSSLPLEQLKKELKELCVMFSACE